MVRKRDDLGGYYHQAPWTKEELADLESRIYRPPVTIARVRPPAGPFAPASPASEPPQEEPPASPSAPPGRAAPHP